MEALVYLPFQVLSIKVYFTQVDIDSAIHVWMQEAMQRIIKLLGLLLPDLLIRKCSYQTFHSHIVLNMRILVLLPIPLTGHIFHPPAISPRCSLHCQHAQSSAGLTLSRIEFKAYSGCFFCQSLSLLAQVIKLGCQQGNVVREIQVLQHCCELQPYPSSLVCCYLPHDPIQGK